MMRPKTQSTPFDIGLHSINNVLTEVIDYHDVFHTQHLSGTNSIQCLQLFGREYFLERIDALFRIDQPS